MVVGDGESAWDFRNGFGRKKGKEMIFFLSYTKAKAENAQVRNGLRKTLMMMEMVMKVMIFMEMILLEDWTCFFEDICAFF